MKDSSRLTKKDLLARIKELEQPQAAATGTPGGRHHAESALEESEQRMRAILQTAVEGIITIDERGCIESINPAAQRIFGYTAAEVIGQNISMLMPAPYRQEHDQYMLNYLRTGQAKIIGIGREVLGQTKTGAVFPMDLAVSEVRLPDRRLFTGFVRDISERKRSELRQAVQFATTRALADSGSLAEAIPSLLKAICQTMAWSVGEFWHVDPEANVLHFVQAWQAEDSSEDFTTKARNLTFAKGVGLPGRVWETAQPIWLSNVGHQEDFPRAASAREEGLQGAFAFPFLLGGEVLGVMAFFCHQNVRPDPETLNTFLAIGSQVGQFMERKRAEAKLAELARTLAEKNKELETIVYVASHDLRSPLVNIMGFSKELGRACDKIKAKLTSTTDDKVDRAEILELLSADVPEAIQFILAGVTRIDTLLSGFLRFSRLGRAALKIEKLDMNRLLATIASAMEFQLKRAGAALLIQPLPGCYADAVQLNQVFSNLLDNALKYLVPSRAGQITVSGETRNGRSLYRVADNGRGIALEHQGKIFEIFHRLNPAETEGEGLGLTIAQRSLERQNGRIWLESKVGVGTTFFVSLPKAG